LLIIHYQVLIKRSARKG